MLITRECDYAVRIIRELADYEMKTVKDICDREAIPQQYAYKILKKLENGKLVRGYRGANGGYRLVKKTDQITLHDIVSAVDDQLHMNECLNPGYLCPRNQDGNYCSVHEEFNRLESILIASMQEKTMADILEDKGPA